MTGIQFNNEAAHGLGQCPGCGAAIHVVGSAEERRLRWCCLQCMTVGCAPFDPEAPGTMIYDEGSAAELH